MTMNLIPKKATDSIFSHLETPGYANNCRLPVQAIIPVCLIKPPGCPQSAIHQLTHQPWNAFNAVRRPCHWALADNANCQELPAEFSSVEVRRLIRFLHRSKSCPRCEFKSDYLQCYTSISIIWCHHASSLTKGILSLLCWHVLTFSTTSSLRGENINCNTGIVHQKKTN